MSHPSDVVAGWSVREVSAAVAVKVGVTRIPIDRSVRAAVWAMTNGRCWYCGKDTNPFDDFTIDHVIALAAGGTNDFSNLVPACRTCNSRKQAREVGELRDAKGGDLWFEQNLKGERFTAGQRVRHRMFGRGVVAAEDAVNGEAASLVKFDGADICRRIVNSYLAAEGGKE